MTTQPTQFHGERSLILVLLFSLLTVASFGQTIRRLNNNPGVTGTNIYSTIQAAHDASANGDFIYAEPSATSYGDLISVKALTIIGPGYYLSENFASPPSTTTATLGNIQFNTGSSGSALYGCDPGNINIRVSNITVSQNINPGQITVGPTTAVAITGVSITKNFSIGIGGSGVGTYQVNISNNWVSGQIILTEASSSGVFANNILSSTLSLRNFTVTSNIASTTGTITLNSCTTNNNIDALGSAFGTSNGNQANVNPMFEGNAFPTGLGIIDAHARLKPGSPAIGAGAGGTDCGMFGGLSPYILSGIAPFPRITKLIGTSTGNSTTPLSITISTNSNN